MRARLPVVVALFAVIAPAAPAPLTFVRAMELPRVEGRIDHLAYDATAHRLYVAALGNGSVEALDTAAGTHVRSAPAFHEPQGVAVVADRNLVAVAEGQGEGLQLLAGRALERTRSVALGDDADNVRYDARARILYVGYGDGAIAAIDPADGRVSGRAQVGGHPESFQLEPGGSRIFVNVPSARRIAIVDRTTMKPSGAWPVTAAEANYPMALDEAGHRLFVGCRRPARLLVYDTQSGRQTATAEIAGDTDDIFFDAARHRVYVIAGDGVVDVLDAAAPAPVRIARVLTAPGARTGLFVPGEGRLYVAVPHRGGQRAEVREFSVGR
jgi:hypothetical protein